MRNVLETPVLIVGGSIVGLSAATFLAAQGIHPLLVERRLAPSRRLRAKLFYPRTMELYRSVGLEQRIFDAEPKGAPHTDVAVVESLAGREVKRWTVPAASEFRDVSPTRTAFLKQRNLEIVVRAKAAELGAEMRFGSECVTFTQTDGIVEATVLDTASGIEETVRARYLIAADGNRSSIRDRLGIRCEGLGDLSHSMDIGFRADLRAAVRDRPLAFVFLRQPDLIAYVAWEDSLDTGTVSVNFDPAFDDIDTRFSDANCLDIISRALGLSKASITITGRREWPMSSWIAERYRDGRVFLAGDSAHVMPPVGGFGANTGVQDAQNLCLKLAQVIRGDASETILHAYEEERHPVGRMTVDQATLRSADRPGVRAKIDPSLTLLSEEAVTLGYCYRSATIASDRCEGAIAVDPDLRHGEAGTRAPHLMLQKDGATLSSLDLFGRRLVLIAGSAGAAWREAAIKVAAAMVVCIDCYQLEQDLLDPTGRFLALYGIDNDGAVLVRPDGFIAWRSQRLQPGFAGEVRAAVKLALGRLI